MHPYLTNLGVPVRIQEHFAPYYRSDEYGNLEFSYATSAEKYGPGIHLVPQSEALWCAGDITGNGVTEVLITYSAMEAIAFLSLKGHQFNQPDKLLFVATGAGISMQQILWIREAFAGKSFNLLLGSDLLGHTADLKAAAGLRNIPIAIRLTTQFRLEVVFRFRLFGFDPVNFSLNTFERDSGYRFGMKTFKQKGAVSFLARLMQQHDSAG